MMFDSVFKWQWIVCILSSSHCVMKLMLGIAAINSITLLSTLSHAPSTTPTTMEVAATPAFQCALAQDSNSFVVCWCVYGVGGGMSAVLEFSGVNCSLCISMCALCTYTRNNASITTPRCIHYHQSSYLPICSICVIHPYTLEREITACEVSFLLDLWRCIL